MKLEIEKAEGKRAKNQVAKDYGATIKEEVDKMMRKFRSKRNDKVVGKINPKHLSIFYVNAAYDLNFKTKDNDIADAICVGTAFMKMERL